MDERSKELTPPSECAVSPPPEFTLPPELLLPGTALPGEETSVSDAAAALQAKAAKWKKLAYILVGGSALAASLLLGSTDTAASDTPSDTGAAPAAYEEPAGG